jgi:hypothetical protein
MPLLPLILIPLLFLALQFLQKSYLNLHNKILITYILTLSSGLIYAWVVWEVIIK